MIRHRVPDGAIDMPLEKYLRRAWPMWPERVTRSIVKARDVKRDGRRLGAQDTVRSGDELTIYVPDLWRPKPPEIVYEDGRLLAVVKPQGLPVDVDRDAIGADTLLERIRLVHPAARLCHRLDAQAGGLVLAATDDGVYEGMLEIFRAHALEKRYLALAKGGFSKPSETLRAYLQKDASRALVHVRHRPGAGAKAIETRYKVIDERIDVARVELEPITGRTHQLRAHMADIGHPLVGDDLYGDRELNRALGGSLRLWCLSLTILKNGPLPEYVGMRFTGPEPAWWTASGGNGI